ncbi:MAG TPA: diaminopimelate epimerase [Actinomycetota bacterium]|nr:diaminopimelate epimerase [Actinomycetota bacterium]
MRFAKYHGTGNDFVLVEDLEDRRRLSPELVAAVCHRRTGVGADGVIRIAPADGADFFMDYYNADGGVAEMCGNGIRCLAKHVVDRGLTASRELRVATRAGLKHVVVEVEDGVAREVTVDMGPPAFERAAIPMAGEPGERFVGAELEVAGRRFRATALSMGNPHVVLFLPPEEELEGVEVARLGPLVEGWPEFPARTNVEFVKVEDGAVAARVWERGSGETLACGTGACAALVAASLAGLTGRRARVRFPGGLLTVEWREGDGHVLLTGPAIRVYEGELDPAWLGEAGAEGAR